MLLTPLSIKLARYWPILSLKHGSPGPRQTSSLSHWPLFQLPHFVQQRPHLLMAADVGLCIVARKRAEPPYTIMKNVGPHTTLQAKRWVWPETPCYRMSLLHMRDRDALSRGLMRGLQKRGQPVKTFIAGCGDTTPRSTSRCQYRAKDGLLALPTTSATGYVPYRKCLPASVAER